MSTKYNIVNPREGKDGKTHWDKVGIMIKNGDRISMYIPALGQWFQVFKDEGKENEKPAEKNTADSGNDFDDDCPF